MCRVRQLFLITSAIFLLGLNSSSAFSATQNQIKCLNVLAITCSVIYSTITSSYEPLIVTSSAVGGGLGLNYLYRRFYQAQSAALVASGVVSYGSLEEIGRVRANLNAAVQEALIRFPDLEANTGALNQELIPTIVDLRRGYDTHLRHIINGVKTPPQAQFSGNVPNFLYHGIEELGADMNDIFSRGLRSPRMINGLGEVAINSFTANYVSNHQRFVDDCQYCGLVATSKDIGVALSFKHLVYILRPTSEAIDINSLLGSGNSWRPGENEVAIPNMVPTENIYGMYHASDEFSGLLYLNPSFQP
jgi:hypothetical protein